MGLVKIARQTLFRTVVIAVGTTVMSFAVGERGWAQLKIQQKKVGICRQAAEWCQWGWWIKIY